MVFRLREMDYHSRVRTLELYALDARKVRGDLRYTNSLFVTGRAERFFSLSYTSHMRGHDRPLF